MPQHLLHALTAIMTLVPATAGGLSGQADSEGARMVPPFATSAPVRCQSSEAVQRETRDYRMFTVFDRVSNTTRVTVVPIRRSRRSHERASLSFSVSATYRGPELTAAPDSVELLFMAFSPARSGWALAHPDPLRLTMDDTVQTEIPSSSYRRLPVALTARGRREMIVYRVATDQLMALAAAPESRLKVGRFTIKVGQYGREGLRALAAMLMAAQP